MFHPHLSRSRGLYARFVREGLGISHKQEYFPPQTLPCLGEEIFVSEYREPIDKKVHGESPKGRPLPLERLAAGSKHSLSPQILRSRSQARKITAARRDFVLRALEAGHRPSLIAAFLCRS